MSKFDDRYNSNTLECIFCSSKEDLLLQRSLVRIEEKSVSKTGHHVVVCKFCRKRLAHFSYEFFRGACANHIYDKSKEG